jgi:hypothetical protein
MRHLTYFDRPVDLIKIQKEKKFFWMQESLYAFTFKVFNTLRNDSINSVFYSKYILNIKN